MNFYRRFFIFFLGIVFFYCQGSDENNQEAQSTVKAFSEETSKDGKSPTIDLFRITQKTYPFNSDWEKIVKEEFGDSFRVADWEDVQSYYNSGNDFDELLKAVELKKRGDNASIKVSGGQYLAGVRSYFIERHDHNVPSDWAAHGNIDSFKITLGSYDQDRRILAIKAPSLSWDDKGRRWKEFGVTEREYSSESDWEKIVEDVFGSSYRVADWNDLKLYNTKNKNILEIFDGLGLSEYQDSAFLTNGGARNFIPGRAYFVERHNHDLPDGWLAHDEINDNEVTLGSFFVNRKIMVIKK